MSMGTTGALEANLARTAVEVVIPPEHAALLDIVAPWRGVHDATDALLREIHHRYRNWAQTLADLHRRAMADFHYHDASDRGPDAIRIVCDLYAITTRDASPDQVRDDAARHWLTYLDLVVRESDATAARNRVAAGEAIRELGELIAASPRLAAVASPGLRRLARTLTAAPEADGELTEQVLALLADTLDTVLTDWLARDDPADWTRELDVTLPGGATAVTHDDLRAAKHALHALTPPLAAHAATILAVPDNSQIVRSYLGAADALRTDAGAIPQIRWLLRVLRHPDLTAAHETALRDITRTAAALMSDETADRRGALVALFGLLHEHEFPYPHTVLHLIAQIGSEALRAGDPDVAHTLVDEVLATDFQYPDFAGFTDEWALRANPAHVEAIRTYLRLIRANPVAARPLIAALVAHLRLGGVSIPDSALLQRDVSALLAAPIEPVYVEITHLLRLLPVFFAEIGSEGRLRDVSTRIDEALHRRDPLCHFLRKQCHVECNAHLIDFVEEVARYWATGDPEPLRAYVPPSLHETLRTGSVDQRGVHDVVDALVRRAGSLEAVLDEEPDALRAALDALDVGDATDRERAALIVEIRREIRRKYALDHADAVSRLRQYTRIDADQVDALDDALAAGDDPRALQATLDILEELQCIVQHPGEVNAVEDIYFKRHIAVGIPSMYGSYREERLDAIGLSFRLESLADVLATRSMTDDALPDDPRERLTRVAAWMHLLHRGLRVEGFRVQGLAHTLAMLDEALAAPATTDAQLLTVVHQLGRNLEVTIRARILDPYEDPVRRVVTRMIERGILPRRDDADAGVLRHSEGLLRDLISGSFALSRLDALIGMTIRELSARVHGPHGATGTAPQGLDETPDDLARAIMAVAAAPADLGIVALGGKAFMLRQLHLLGMNVPGAFVLTTDVFRARHRIRRDPALGAVIDRRVQDELARIERTTGTRFADPSRPLLLSVRGGAPLSMPGMLATFLNVGMNPTIAAGVAAARGEWAAWDSYRRFLQSWGMAHGLDRNDFDALIADAKHRLGVAHKAHLPADAMRTLAGDYRALIAGHDIHVEDDPLRQLTTCIELVHASWDAAAARLYRQELHISEEWGTAVIAQAMVFGNLDQRSGSGVILTDQPERSADILSLSGDFAIQSQGDDVVGGLVETHPITERQRHREARTTGVSLEKDFPVIHRELRRIAINLVQDHGMNHQEIEFTFEHDAVDGLYLLQTRDTVVATAGQVPAFIPSDDLERCWVAHGIGVSGGALSGRVACNMGDIEHVRSAHPDDAVILLRPDTVPDDIPLVLAADGVLTALGGATSHAAVAAKRLGKTCVVGCRDLDVDEHGGRTTLAGRPLRAGDMLSISGLDGTVYLDTHAVTMVGVEGAHRW